MTRRVLGLLVSAVLLTSASCTQEPPDPRPLRERRSVVVFGDSLTPAEDYRIGANIYRYDFTSHARGGSFMCGSSDPAEPPYWSRILTAIRSGVDAVVLSYQGWQNTSPNFDCGSSASDASTVPHSAIWRAYLEQFRQAAVSSDTHIFVTEAPGAPPDALSWLGPQARVDAGSTAMAERWPETITFVRTRWLLTDTAGRYATHLPCIEAERVGGVCGLDGMVRIRASDGIHWACPGTSGLVCAGSTPAGIRLRLMLFSAMNAWFER